MAVPREPQDPDLAALEAGDIEPAPQAVAADPADPPRAGEVNEIFILFL